MRRLALVISCLVVLLFATALPAFADDGDLLGSGAVAPSNGQPAAAPVEAEAVESVAAAGQSALASTGLDSGAALLVGLGLMAAGGAAVLTSRRRAAA